MPDAARTIQLVHSLPGRTRFRSEWLAGAAGEARRIAEELARLDGVIEVHARPRTGSILVLHLASVGVDALAAALRSVTGAEVIHGRAPTNGMELPTAGGAGTVTRTTLDAIRNLDRRVARESEGRLDLAMLSAVTLFGAAALGVLVTRRIPAPPWYSLTWWGLRILRDQAWALQRPRAFPAPGGQGTVDEHPR